MAEQQGNPRVSGYCPACGGRSLFLAAGGWVTCSRSDCSNPTALADAMDHVNVGRRLIAGANVLHIQSIREQLIELLDGHDPFEGSFSKFFDRLQVERER